MGVVQRPGTKQRLAEMEAMPKEKLGVAQRAYVMLIVTLGPSISHQVTTV